MYPNDPQHDMHPVFPSAPSSLPPYQGGPGGAVPRPARKGSAGRTVLITLAAVVVLAAAVIGAAFAIAPDENNEALGGSSGQGTGVSAAGTGAPTSAQPTAPGSDAPVVGGEITVVTPATLGGRPKIETGDDEGDVSGDSGVPEVTATAQGIYGNVATQDLVIVNALASTSETPEARFSLFASAISKELSVNNLTSADPGPLGGLARCGDGNINGVPAAVCVWSDAGSTGAFVRSLQDAQVFRSELPALRAEIEQVSDGA